MLIPLGILASSGAAPLTSDYELISTSILASDTSAVTFDVSSFASTYKHLQIRGTARCTNSSTLAGLVTRFNGDSGTNYSTHSLNGVNGSIASGGAASQSNFGFYLPGGTAAGGGSWTSFVIDILDPFSTTKNKTARTFSGFQADGSWAIVEFNSASWMNTQSITSIYLGPNQNQFRLGSRFSIYGLKG
jgi:hypothetical protein